MTTKQKLRQAQQRVAEQRDRARAARLAGTATGARAPQRSASPPATPRNARPQAQATAPPLLLSRADLRQFYGISWSRETLRRRIAAGTFPAPVAFGPEPYARKAFKRNSIEAWVKDLEEFTYSAPDEAT